MSRRRRTISYEEASSDEPDLEQLLNMLRRSKVSPYWNRSLSDIGGMILLTGAQAEVDRYGAREHPTAGTGVEA